MLIKNLKFLLVYAADCPTGEVPSDLGCIPQDPVPFASRIYSYGLGFIGIVAVLFIMYGGFLVLTSKGDQFQLQKGKSYIVSAIIGIVLAVSGFVLYQILAVDVLKIPGFGR